MFPVARSDSIEVTPPALYSKQSGWWWRCANPHTPSIHNPEINASLQPSQETTQGDMKKNPLSEDMFLTTCRCLLLRPALSTPSEHRASLFHCSNHCLYTPPAKHIPLCENPWLMHNSYHFTDIFLPMHLCYLY